MRQIVFGEWTLAPDSGELSRGGSHVRLQEQLLQTLLALLERPGEVVTREELIARLWPEVVVDYESSLKSIVRKLRIALGDDAGQPRYIETLPRKGYRLIAPVAVDAGVATISSSTAAPRPKRQFGWAIAAALAVAIASIVLMTVGSKPEPIRLAVMPFENMSSDPANAFFTDSLHEEVVTALRGSSTALAVFPRATMIQYRSRPDAIAAVRAELEATHILEGAVRREGENVRVSVELMDTDDGRPLWSQRYERVLHNSMTLQSEVASAVVAQLAVKLENRGGGLAPSTDPEAHDFYRRALVSMQSLDQRTPAPEVQQAEEWLTAAVALDETFAAAYARRAQLRISKYVLNHDVGEANREAARADIERARALAGDAVAVVQASSRYSALFETGPDRALEILDTLELSASREPDVLLWRGFFLCRAGRQAEGLEAYALAARLDPGNATIVTSWKRELWSLHRPLEALELVRQFNGRQLAPLGLGDLELAFTGKTAGLRKELDHGSATMAPDHLVQAKFDLLRYERRLDELLAILSAYPDASIRVGGFRDYGLPGVGTKPISELRGWANLLTNRPVDAGDDGREVLAFVEGQTRTPHNGWHLALLRAEAALFLGDRSTAIELASDALEQTPRLFDFVTLYSTMLAARVYAWAGAEDSAVELLQTLATASPSLGPAEIARDPFFAQPLAGNARYRSLAERLETEIARNRAAFLHAQ